MKPLDIDFDVESPDQVPDRLDELANALSRIADTYRESQSELQSAWQDSGAGACWPRIASRIDIIARSISRAARRMEQSPNCSA